MCRQPERLTRPVRGVSDPGRTTRQLRIWCFSITSRSPPTKPLPRRPHEPRSAALSRFERRRCSHAPPKWSSRPGTTRSTRWHCCDSTSHRTRLPPGTPPTPLAPCVRGISLERPRSTSTRSGTSGGTAPKVSVRSERRPQSSGHALQVTGDYHAGYESPVSRSPAQLDRTDTCSALLSILRCSDRVLVAHWSADAIEWMRARQLTSALVNTGIDNGPALALYERFGFRRMREQLVIAELRFTT